MEDKVNEKNFVSVQNQDVLMIVKRIVEKGNSVEIKRTTDGRLKVFEVKRSIAAGRD